VTDVLKTLLQNSAALAVFLSAVSLLIIAVIAIYVVALVQGRSLSFWPPNVGMKPEKMTVDTSESSKPKPALESSTPIGATTALADSLPRSPLSIQIGSKLTTSAGASIQIESRNYTGVRAALMKARYSDGSPVMAKLYWRGLNPSSTAWFEFSRELKANEGLRHRNIVRTIDRGLHSGYPFIVFEYLAGGTLYDLIQSRDRIPGSEILSIAEQVAAGVDYAHTQGRIHRDISPSNILFESDPMGRVAISDFGIAKVLGAMDSHATAQEPQFEGTPAYVAPEVFSSGPVSGLMDIYSFGVVLFELIAGRSPFTEVESLFQLFRMKHQEPVPRLGKFRKVPSDLEERLLVTLDPIPENRPQTARAVLSGIERSILSL
jgi:serine/threonine protein kinase